MSLIFGARSKSSHLLTGNLRAFQTLSTQTKSTPSDFGNRKKSAIVATSAVDRQWITRSPNQTAANLRVSSLSTVSKSLFFPPSYRSAAESISLTTRSMASVPECEKNFRDGKPTLEYVKQLPKKFSSMTNDQIMHFAELEIPEACRECIVRDVMLVDQVEYDEAMVIFKKIAATNREGMFFSALPFYFGCGASVTAGYASIPLTFNLATVNWFNDNMVTSDMPPAEDLETWLEVGAASWGWMEPMLGQVSFFLLCMQFARGQLKNLGIRPYTNWQKGRRAAYLIKSYPQYDAEFLANYSRIDRLVKPHEMAD